MKFRFLAGATALILFAGGCVSPSFPSVATVRYGVSLTPESFDGPAFNRFLDLSKQAGGILSWAGNAEQLAKTNNAGHVTVTLARQRGLQPVIVTGVTESQLDDAKTSSQLLEAIEAFARDEQPEYFGVGNEINFTYRTDAVRKKASAFFTTASERIKRVSPKTRVFPIFQYEWLKGLHGGIFGGKNDPSAAEWNILDDYAKADLIAFTTYPGLIYANPEDIPSDYYAVLSDRASLPIAFTEIAWSREGTTKEWESSPDEQARFIKRLPELMAGLNPSFVIWPFLFDQKTNPYFASLGLLPNGKTESPGWTAWQELIK